MSTGPHGYTTELEKRRRAELKKEMEEKGFGYLTPVPYGNDEEQLTAAEKNRVKSFWQATVEDSKWPQWLMSFEVWCAMTCYDPEKPNGGAPFQRLMLLLLGGISKQSGLPKGLDWYHTLEFDHFWHPDKKGLDRYGPMFEKKTIVKEDQRQTWEMFQTLKGDDKLAGRAVDVVGFVGGGAHLGHQSRPTIVPLTSTQPAYADPNKTYEEAFPTRNHPPKPPPKTGTGTYPGRPVPLGLGLGNHNNSNSPALKPGGEYIQAHHYEIFSKHDWMLKANLQTGTKGSQAQGGQSSGNVGQSYVTEGHDKLEDGAQCWETTNPYEEDSKPCVPAANTLAAIYGLYFYPNCTEFELDNVYEKVGDETFEIRMRCPNPQYGRRDPSRWYKSATDEGPMEDGNLYIYETLNALNKDYLDTFWRKKVFDIHPEKPEWPGRVTHTYVGGPTKQYQEGQRIEVPHMGRVGVKSATGQRELSPWMHMHNEEGKMQVGPFWRHANSHHVPNQPPFDRGREMREKGGITVCSAVTEKSETSVSFGFRMPAAMLLFPNHTTTKPKPDAGGSSSVVKLSEAKRQYMLEPQWDAGGIDLDLSANFLTSATTSLAYTLLNWKEWDIGQSGWRQKLLQADPNPDVVTPAAPPPPPQPQPQPQPPPAATTATGNGQIPDTVHAVGSAAPAASGEEYSGTLPTGEIFGSPEDDDAAGTAVDGDAQEAAAQTRNDNRNVVETTFGIPGMGIAETLANCTETLSIDGVTLPHGGVLAKMDIQESDIRKVMLRKESDLDKPYATFKDKRVKIAYEALKMCGLYEAGLAEGAPRRGNEKQCHWRSSSHQPWSYSQCYELPKLIYEYEDVVGDAAIKAYRDKYGNDVNLYLNNQTNPTRIKGITTQWGAKKAVMDEIITKPDKLFRLNLVKILCVFFDDSGVGDMSPDDKRKGMLNGLMKAKQSPQGQIQKVQPKSNRKPLEETSGFEDLFGHVFSDTLKFKHNTQKLKKCIAHYICKRDVTNDNELEECMIRSFGVEWWKDSMWEGVKSTMTVQQWVCTPWHYEHLPYERQYAIFRDGECYAEGCKRCSRPFYEYAYHVYADGRSSEPGTYGYPSDLWYRSKPHENRAPVPLHDPYFFVKDSTFANADWDQANAEPRNPNMAEGGLQAAPSAPPAVNARINRLDQGKREELELLAAVDRQEGIPREFEEYVGGTMAWPTYKLVVEHLHDTDQTRAGVVKHKDRGMHFRRYYNLAYSDAPNHDPDQPGSGLKNEKGFYEAIPQGVMNNRQKARFGMLDYRLQRSHKYGNVCRDCASLLDRAPGLFVRNNRWSFDGGLIAGGNLQVVRDANYNYWTTMLGRGGIVNNGKGGYAIKAVSLDHFLLRAKDAQGNRVHRLKKDVLLKQPNGQAIWDQALKDFETAAEAFAASIDEKHTFPNNFTLINVSDISTQFQEHQTVKLTTNAVQDAVRQMNTALNTNDGAAMDMNNAAIRHMVKEIERKYMRNETYQRIDYTKQFDSDIMRTEYRNCTITYGRDSIIWENSPIGPQPLPSFKMMADGPVIDRKFSNLTSSRYPLPGDGKTYYNCLLTVQYDPPAQGYNNRNLRAQTIDYRVDFYLCTLTNRLGLDKATAMPTQWHGDKFVTEWNEALGQWTAKSDRNFDDRGVALTQMRTLKQSRIFITYSLHRPITSEKLGRQVLEKMADALHELFGNDKWLSQMIVFGRKLKSFYASAEQKGSLGDNVSRSMWGIIDKTRKDDAMGTFYGSRGKDAPSGTSYLHDTYETHIDSVEVDGGCEIGPKMGHPHFHLLLTLNHYSYVQFDYYKMNTFLELMFKGVQSVHKFGGPLGPNDHKKFMLGSEEEPFYGDNENPYVDIRLYPQDNWKEVLAAYVRKASGSADMFSVLAGRALPKTAEARRQAHAAAQRPSPQTAPTQPVPAGGVGGRPAQDADDDSDFSDN